MTTKRKTSSYDKLAKKFGKVTFSSHLEAVIKTDFESQTACTRKLDISPQTLNDYITAQRTPHPPLQERWKKS